MEVLAFTDNTDGGEGRFISIPGRRVGCDFEAAGVADEFIQDADDLLELGPVVPLFLPAVQHQLVEGGRAVHGRGEAVTFIHRLYDLDTGKNRDSDVRRIRTEAQQHLKVNLATAVSDTHVLIGHLPVRPLPV